MLLDTSTNNSQKKNSDIPKVCLSEIYESEDSDEIRKSMALQSSTTQLFQKLTTKDKENAIKEASELLNLNDRELISELKKSNKMLKDTFKPTYQVINYNLPDDGTIYAVVRNKKLNSTESFYIKLEDKSLDSYLQELINKLNAENHKKTTNNKYISNLKKKISILEQINELQK